MSRSAFPVAFTVLIGGGYLVDCAVQNRGPIDTIKAILNNPGDIRGTLQNQPPKYPSGQPPFDGGGTDPGGGGGGGPTPPPTGDIGKVLAYERAQIGKPYCWGGTGPSCYDCSGLPYMAYKTIGITIPRTTAAQLVSTRLKKITSLAACLPGDLIYPYPGHVFTYIGHGQMIEAPHTGTQIHQAAVYKFWTARRVIT